MHSFYEFFAGGGMARAGLGKGWKCLFANDFDAKKGMSYAENWGADHLHVGDVAQIESSMLPAEADLIWASFPCQDLSLAGAGAGLKGSRSGTFWPFWELVKKLGKEGRAPRLILLENVCGALTSHGGKDFSAIAEALAGEGYRVGAVVVDAVSFVPQSRPRLFFVGVHADVLIPHELLSDNPLGQWHTPSLIDAFNRLPKSSKDAWLWWKMPAPAPRISVFADLIEEDPTGVRWHTIDETRKLLAAMSPLHLEKVEKAKKSGHRMVGAIYRRTRPNGLGGKGVRAEIRFDNVAGCLRTPSGGSSRQIIMLVEGSKIRTRLLSPREAARLMGLPETYRLPTNYNDAYHLAGDGLAVPAVRYIAANILEPLLVGGHAMKMAA
ncbi:MAG: DNA cytosine methyltransferase [Pseudomonadota bacterium]